MNPIDTYIGQQVKNARYERKMTQDELAGHIGLTFQQVQKYERGTNRIAASRLVDIARAMDKPLLYFFPADASLPPVDETKLIKIKREEIHGIIRDLEALLKKRKQP